ncbi:DNA pilot protein [Blackfly microvirus SF02]|uniref:DNA pilot protein n=1 Tax=Blackfly microvirus SF02 TaxID=2576452 RepID=A0A4P8PU63_9VIRU|nr:DNA pilot protein [Blackfly microvirus SF02]
MIDPGGTIPQSQTGIAPGVGLAVSGGIAVAQAIARGGPRRQYKWNKKAANDTNQMNRDNAIWALEENKKIQNEQRVYDSPEAQMARYKKAGLNPHLIYGNGSSAGSAFPISTQGIAPSRIDAPSAAYPDVAGSFLNASQTAAQTELTQAKTTESGYKSALLDIQKDIARTNPMLRPEVATNVAYAMEQTAELKADLATQQMEIPTNDSMTRGRRKVMNDIEKLNQELGLNTTDQQIRNKILESKEYENALKKIQVEWMKDGDVTPQHIYQGLMLLLQKML